jgi:hypothetical protein
VGSDGETCFGPGCRIREYGGWWDVNQGGVVGDVNVDIVDDDDGDGDKRRSGVVAAG